MSLTRLKINDLTPQQFQRAYEKWRQDCIFDEWWDGVYSWKKEEGKELGFDIDNIYFSGFWSQGDGASWTGSVDVMKRMELEPDAFSLHEHNVMRQAVLSDLFAYNSPQFNITTRGSYSHSGTMQPGEIELSSIAYSDGEEVKEGIFMGMRYEDFYEMLYPVIESVTATCFKQAQAYADGIYKALEKEEEYLTSEEQFKERAEMNEYEFDEEGEMI